MSDRRNRGRRRGRGFTLPEVMIALSIMAFAVSVFGASFPACAQTLSRSRNMDMATAACQQQLDYYREVGYFSLPAVQDGAASNTTVSFTPPSTLPAATGLLQFTMINSNLAPSTTDNQRLRVEATVTWAGRGSDRGSVTVTSIIAAIPQ